MSHPTVAVIICDRKQHSQLVAMQKIIEMEGDFQIYLNIESQYPIGDKNNLYSPVLELLKNQPRGYAVDIWQRQSTWLRGPSYDQDQARLEPICIARNMARTYAMFQPSNHLFFVDADVEVPANCLNKLLEINANIVCGTVPGRGVHGSGLYITGKGREISSCVFECSHATMGCCLIKYDLYSILPFRWGGHRVHKEVMLSEDPAFSSDAELLGYGKTLVRTDVVCGHVDNPLAPLTNEGTAKDTWKAIRNENNK